jgi:two-component system response regulator CpxR
MDGGKAMRAPKLILLVGSHLDRMSRRAFLLKTWGYRVTTAATAKEALATLEICGGQGSPNEVDLLLIDLPLMDLTAKILADAKHAHPGLRTLITSNHSAYYDPYGADVLLTTYGDSPARLLEQIRILVARKRGPHKKPPPIPLPLFGSKSRKPVVSEKAPRRAEAKHG